MLRSIAMLLLAWTASNAAAHTPGNCDEIQSVEQRLACYDVLFPPKNPPQQGLQKEAPLSTVTPQDANSRPSTTSSADEAVADATEVAAAPTEIQPAPTEIQPAPTEIQPAPTEEPPLSAEDQFGREHLEKNKSREEQGLTSIDSKITSIKKRAHQEMVFYLENGQVWLEVTARFRAIKEGAEVTVNKARLGGYILTAENGVSTRVKRLR